MPTSNNVGTIISIRDETPPDVIRADADGVLLVEEGKLAESQKTPGAEHGGSLEPTLAEGLALIVVSAETTEARASVATTDIAANNSNLLTVLPSTNILITGKGLQHAHPPEWTCYSSYNPYVNMT